MSTEINTYEVLEIHNVNAATMDTTEKLVEYLQQFIKGKELTDLNIPKLELTVDDRSFSLEGSEDNGTQPLWKEDTPLIQFLTYLPTAKHIRLEFCFSIMVRVARYGYDYFEHYFRNVEEPEKLAENVTYKCLEYHDCDPEVFSYCFQKTSNGFIMGDPEYADNLSVADDISCWYNCNFECKIDGSETLGTEEERQELLLKIQEFLEKFDDCEGGMDDTDEETYFYIQDITVFLKPEQIDEYKAYLQYFYDFALANQAEFTLFADFTPDSEFEFARLTFLAEDGKIIPKAMRY